MSIFDVFDRISANSNTPKGKIEYVIAGLGNPGMEYDNTRHNAGFMVLDMLASQLGEDISRLRFKGKTAEVTIEGKRCLLLKPTTFMNNSGEAIVQALEFYKGCYTTYGWKSFNDVALNYEETNSNGTENWGVTIAAGSSYGYNPDFQYCVYYNVNGQTFWANNFDANYDASFRIYP